MTEKHRDQSYTEDDDTAQTASDREYPQVSDEGTAHEEDHGDSDEILVRYKLQQFEYTKF